MRVLLIDDDHTIRYTLKKVIGKYLRDVQIYTSEDGVEGLGYAYIINPDLIVIDTTLPRYSGRELMEYLVTNDRFRETTIILLHEDGADFGELPINYRQISKKDKNFTEKLLGYITKEEQKRNKVELKIVEKIIKYSNKSNIKTSEIEKSNFFVRIFKYLGYMFDQVLVSFYLTIFFITSGRKEYDENIEQRNKDSERYRRRVYPSIAIFLATIIAILVQIGVLLGAVIGPILVSNRVVNAASYTWDGGGATNNWSDCANWSTNICPTSVDTVTFNNTSTKDSVVDAGFGGVTGDVTIANGYTGTISLERDLTVGRLTQSDGIFNSSNQLLTINIDLILNPGSSFTASSTTTTVRRAINITGGSFNHNNGVLAMTHVSGNTYSMSCNNVTFNLITISTNGVFTINSDCDLPIGNNPTISDNGTINISGTLEGTGTLTRTSTYAPLVFNVGGSLVGFSGFNSALTVSGATLDFSTYTSFTTPNSAANIILSSGSLTLPDNADLIGALTISGGTFTAPSGTMSVAGNFTVSGSPTFNANGGTIVKDGSTATWSCNNVTFNKLEHLEGTWVVGNNCTIPLGNNPSIENISLSGTLTGSGKLSLRSNLSLNSTGLLVGFNSIGGNSGFTGTAGGGLAIIGANFNASAYSEVSIEVFNLISGSFTAPPLMRVGHNFIISPGATFNANGGTVRFIPYGGGVVSCNNTIFHRVEIQGSVGVSKIINSDCNLPLGNNPVVTQAITLNGTLTGTGTLNLNSNGNVFNSGATISGFSGFSSASLTISGATIDLSTLSSYTNQNTLNVNSGSITMPPNASVANTTTVAGGNLVFPASGDLNGLVLSSGSMSLISGNLFISGALTISGGTFSQAPNTTVVFDGTGTATLSCNNVTFQRVDFNHTSGTKTVNSNCSFPLGNNETIGASTGTGAITLNGGTFSGTGTLTTPLGTLTIQNGGVLSGFTGIVGRGAFTTLATTASTNLDLSGYTTADFNGAFSITAPTSPHTNTFIAPTGNINFGSSVTLGTGINFNHSNGIFVIDGPGTVDCSSNNPNRFQINQLIGTMHINIYNCEVNLGDNPNVVGRINLGNSVLVGTGTLTAKTPNSTQYNIQLSGANNSTFSGFTAWDIGTLSLASSSNIDLSQMNLSSVKLRRIANFGGSTFVAPEYMELESYLGYISGVFNHNNGTIRITGNDFIFESPQTGTDLTLFNLEKIGSSSITFFPYSSYNKKIIIQGELKINGTEGDNIELKSSTLGSQWQIDLQGTSDIANANVQDSNNIGNIIQAGGRNVINSGNNVGWNFDNPTVSNITIENQTNGYVKTKTPTIKFNLTDPEPSEQVRYQIQIDNNQDFSSPEIDFTSELGIQGEKTHTTTNLTDGIYKMRIKGMDGSGGDGGYVNYQNELKIDTTSPQGSMFVGYTQDSTNRDIFVINKITDNLSGVSEMIISENPNFTNAVWETYKESKIVRVSEGIGIKQINVKYKDQAGNESITYKAGIEITQTPEENPTIENPNNPTEENEEEQIVLKLFAIKIRDRNNNPLRNTIVKIEELGIEVRTDENGIAIFENIPLGSYNILGVTEEGEEFRYPIDITQETELITIEIEERSSPITVIAIVLGLVVVVLLIVLSTLYYRKSTRGGINN